MKTKQKYIVFGWFNGDDYDSGAKQDCFTYLNAEDISQAEDLGQKKLKKKFGECAVIIAELAD
jgi:hypothetical protein